MNISSQKSKNEFWREQIARYQRSGQSQRQYCLAENLSYWTFREWLKKIETDADTKLVKIPRRVHQRQNNQQSFIELFLGEKLSIRVAPDFNADLLRTVLSELGIRL